MENITIQKNKSSLVESNPGSLGEWYNYLIAAIIVVTMASSLVLNAIVFKAVKRIKQEKIPVKFLIQMAVVGDVLLAISIGTREILDVFEISENNDFPQNVFCALLAFECYIYFSVFFQIFSSMALAVDRLYSILRPLQYHAVLYSKIKKMLIFTVILSASLTLTLPIPFVKLNSDDDIGIVCLKVSEKGDYTEKILPIVIVTSVFITLSIYITLASILGYYRHKTLATLGESIENANARKRQTPLALTFFFIQITYVIMYIPGVLYFSLIGESLLLSDGLALFIGKLTTLLYMANTVVDPIIYITRIQSIRLRVKISCCRRCSRQQTSMQREPTDKTDEYSLEGTQAVYRIDVGET